MYSISAGAAAAAPVSLRGIGMSGGVVPYKPDRAFAAAAPRKTKNEKRQSDFAALWKMRIARRISPRGGERNWQSLRSRKTGEKRLAFFSRFPYTPHRKQIFKRGTRDRQNRSYRSGPLVAPPYLVVLCRYQAKLFCLFFANAALLTFGVLRTFCAPASPLFLEIHKVFLRKSVIAGTQKSLAIRSRCTNPCLLETGIGKGRGEK